MLVLGEWVAEFLHSFRQVIGTSVRNLSTVAIPCRAAVTREEESGEGFLLEFVSPVWLDFGCLYGIQTMGMGAGVDIS